MKIEKILKRDVTSDTLTETMINKTNELVEAFNQREEPEKVKEALEVTFKGVFKAWIGVGVFGVSDEILVMENNNGRRYCLEKKEAQKLLSKITHLINSMD